MFFQLFELHAHTSKINLIISKCANVCLMIMSNNTFIGKSKMKFILMVYMRIKLTCYFAVFNEKQNSATIFI